MAFWQDFHYFIAT